jgi:hypothetical protein
MQQRIMISQTIMTLQASYELLWTFSSTEEKQRFQGAEEGRGSHGCQGAETSAAELKRIRDLGHFFRKRVETVRIFLKSSVSLTFSLL